MFFLSPPIIIKVSSGGEPYLWADLASCFIWRFKIPVWLGTIIQNNEIAQIIEGFRLYSSAIYNLLYALHLVWCSVGITMLG